MSAERTLGQMMRDYCMSIYRRLESKISAEQLRVLGEASVGGREGEGDFLFFYY